MLLYAGGDRDDAAGMHPGRPFSWEQFERERALREPDGGLYSGRRDWSH